MKKITFLCFLLVSLSTVAFSQTKLIAHRSHSGANHSFHIRGNDNFGMPYKYFEQEKNRATDANNDSLIKAKPLLTLDIVANILARQDSLQRQAVLDQYQPKDEHGKPAKTASKKE